MAPSGAEPLKQYTIHTHTTINTCRWAVQGLLWSLIQHTYIHTFRVTVRVFVGINYLSISDARYAPTRRRDGIVYGWLNFTARLRQYTLLSAPVRSALGQREDPKSVDTYIALTSHPFPRVVGANMR